MRKKADLAKAMGLDSSVVGSFIQNGIDRGQHLCKSWTQESGYTAPSGMQGDDWKLAAENIISAAKSAGVNPYFFVAIAAVLNSGNPNAEYVTGFGKGLWGEGLELVASPKKEKINDIKEQADDGAGKIKSIKSKVSGSGDACMKIATSYVSGVELFTGKGDKWPGLGQDAKWTDVNSKVSEYPSETKASGNDIAKFYPMVIGAWEAIKDKNILGDCGGAPEFTESHVVSSSSLSPTASGTDKITTDFSTNSETDWLLDPSDDERKYGINIYEGEQPLIKFSTAAGVEDDEEKANSAVDALEKYSEFLYYLLNSEVSTAQPQCLSMPWIRPGFNVWYDPLHSDKIYYCQQVQHYGSPHTGARTTLTLLLGRPRKTFVNDREKFGSLSDKSENVFINNMFEKYRVSKFGECLKTNEDFNAVRSAAEMYYQAESFDTVSAEHSAYHCNLYKNGVGTSPLPDTNIDKSKIFSGEYTKEEIDAQLKTLYANAPEVVKNRASRLKTIVAEAQEYVDRYNVMERNQK